MTAPNDQNDKIEALRRYLESLPDPAALKLATKVESERQADGTHKTIMSALRPTLRRLRPHRPITAMRMVCTPFEDLLVDDPGPRRRPGQIARRSIRALWTYLTTELGPSLGGLESRLAELERHHDAEALTDVCFDLWQQASEKTISFLADPEGCAAVAKQFGIPDRAEDMVDMAATLAIAREIETTKDKLPPKPIEGLNQNDINLIRDRYFAIENRDPRLAAYLPLVIMYRLRHPWEILLLARSMSRKADDTIAHQTELNLIGRAALADVSDAADRLAAALDTAVDVPEWFEETVEDYRAVLLGMSSSIRLTREGPWHHQLIGIKRRIAKKIEARIPDNIDHQVSLALPTHRSRPVIKRPPEAWEVEKLENALSFMRICEPHADTLGVHASLRAGMHAATEAIMNHVEGISPTDVRDDETLGTHARDHLMATIRMLEAVGAEEKAAEARARLGDDSYDE